jgi:hypothetical protein
MAVKRLRIAIMEEVAFQFIWISQDFCRYNQSVSIQRL